MSVVSLKKVDVGKIGFDEPKVVGQGGGRFVGIKYNGKPFKVQFPAAYVKFGIGEYPPKRDRESNAKIKYSLNLSLEDTDGMKNSRPILESIEDKIIKAASDNSQDWVGSTDPDTTFTSLKEKKYAKKGYYSSMFKCGQTKDTYSTPDSIKMKMKYFRERTDGKPDETKPLKPLFGVENRVGRAPVDVQFYGNEMDTKWLGRDSNVSVIGQLNGLWLVNSTVYCDWVVNKIRVNESGSNSNNLQLDDDDDDYVPTKTQNNPPPTENQEYSEEEVSDEDSE